MSMPPAPGQGPHGPAPQTVPVYQPSGAPHAAPVGPVGPVGRGPGGPRPGSGKGRSLPIVLGVAIVVLVAAVLALSFTLLRGGDDGDDVATGDGVDAVSTTTASTTTSTSTTSTAPPQTAPPETAPPQTAPPQTAPPQTAPPQTAPPAQVGTRAELESPVFGYINAGSSGDLDLAYTYLSPSLTSTSGWDFGEFSDFWLDTVTGAGVVSIDSVSTSSGQVTATVDYHLPNGTTSREQIEVVIDSSHRISSYHVVRADVI